MSTFDVLVIGSGPGGYVAAIRAQQLGLKAACIEKEKLGGVCLNWGCIPSKALLKSAEYANLVGHLEEYGIHVGEVRVDMAAAVSRSRKVADKSEKGVKFLFKKYGVTHIQGEARLLGGGKVQVGDQVYEGKHIIVATGARARVFPGIEADGEKVLTYREAIVRTQKPESAIVLGAGAIGLEFAYFWHSMGAKVTIVEGAPRLAPIEDAEVSAELERSFKKLGITCITGAMVDKAERVGDLSRVTLKDGRVLEAEITLAALGVRPNTEGLGLEEAGVKLEKGFVQTDASCRTNVAGIYAIGDVAGPPMLAHKASMEAHICVERIAGRHTPALDKGCIPGGTFCQPQIASVGKTEDQLKAEGVEYKAGKFPFAANGKNRGTGHTEGFVKVLLAPKTGELLGAHIIGYDAVELLAELVLFKSAELDAETFLHAIHSHPTSSEAVMEAVADALGVSVHI